MLTALLLFALQAPDPMHSVDHRGDTMMGFSHRATKHTFRLFADGGAIEVRALDANDASTIQAIRTHLQSIAKAFAEGDFGKPETIHDRLPDGAATMKKLRTIIVYRYADIASGGRVRMATRNARALDAVHRFLRFQIAEHRTGDTTDITRE